MAVYSKISGIIQAVNSSRWLWDVVPGLLYITPLSRSFCLRHEIHCCIIPTIVSIHLTTFFFFVSSCGSIMSPRTLSPGHFVFEKFRQIGMSDTRICNCAGKIHEEFVNMCRCNWGFFLGFRFFSAALYEARYESGSRKLCPTDNFKLRCQFGSV